MVKGVSQLTRVIAMVVPGSHQNKPNCTKHCTPAIYDFAARPFVMIGRIIGSIVFFDLRHGFCINVLFSAPRRRCGPQKVGHKRSAFCSPRNVGLSEMPVPRISPGKSFEIIFQMKTSTMNSSLRNSSNIISFPEKISLFLEPKTGVFDNGGIIRYSIYIYRCTACISTHRWGAESPLVGLCILPTFGSSYLCAGGLCALVGWFQLNIWQNVVTLSHRKVGNLEIIGEESSNYHPGNVFLSFLGVMLETSYYLLCFKEAERWAFLERVGIVELW